MVYGISGALTCLMQLVLRQLEQSGETNGSLAIYEVVIPELFVEAMQIMVYHFGFLTFQQEMYGKVNQDLILKLQ